MWRKNKMLYITQTLQPKTRIKVHLCSRMSDKNRFFSVEYFLDVVINNKNSSFSCEKEMKDKKISPKNIIPNNWNIFGKKNEGKKVTKCVENVLPHNIFWWICSDRVLEQLQGLWMVEIFKPISKREIISIQFSLQKIQFKRYKRCQHHLN